MDDSVTRLRTANTPSAIRALIENPTGDHVREQAEPKSGADPDLLPQPGDPYVASSRPSNKIEPTLHILTKHATYRGFPWNSYDGIDYLPAIDAGGPPLLILRFCVREPVDVLITGRNLGKIHVYLAQNRLAWIRELAGFDQYAPNDVVISNVEIRPVDQTVKPETSGKPLPTRGVSQP